MTTTPRDLLLQEVLAELAACVHARDLEDAGTLAELALVIGHLDDAAVQRLLADLTAHTGGHHPARRPPAVACGPTREGSTAAPGAEFDAPREAPAPGGPGPDELAARRARRRRRQER